MGGSGHVALGPCPACGGMNPARYARQRGRVKCSMVGCPFAMGHLGRHAPGSRVPTFMEAMANLGQAYGSAMASMEHRWARAMARLGDAVPVRPCNQRGEAVLVGALNSDWDSYQPASGMARPSVWKE